MPIERAAAAVDGDWWRGAVTYQVYPRSYLDTNGDGVGDLPGIIARLDHIASLGVDAVWISPFYRSPMRDFGYDVADFTGVDPLFGTMADFDSLVQAAHARGLKVIIDQVYSHTSDAHAWFAESRASCASAKADWYVWADPKPDGSPPNNWQSVFGGPAWTWDARRGQYYLHNFLPSQPDLNGHNPAVQDALLDVARFWLTRGVDGFRLDALNFLMHDPALTDNPAAPWDGKPRTRPFDFQTHLHNQSHPAITGFIERLRGVTDAYGARFTVAEVGGLDSDTEMKAFTSGEARLHSAYGFDFLYAERLTPRLVADAVARWPEDAGWPSWAFSNHDAPRAVSRWASPGNRAAFARMAMLLLLTLRGNPILWQGEELGLTQVDIGYGDLRDPEAIANWPLTLSRDGARTPMPWDSAARALGFTAGRPWLPLGSDHAGLAVVAQERDPDSMLHWTRACVSLRAQLPELRTGSLEIVQADEQRLVFARTGAGRRVMGAFNLADRDAPFDPPGAPLLQTGYVGPDRLGPYAAGIFA